MASLLVGIAGGSGSGKTTLAKAVAAALPPGQVVVIPHDAYYRDLGHLPFQTRIGCNFDEPEALDNERPGSRSEPAARGPGHRAAKLRFRHAHAAGRDHARWTPRPW